MAKVYIAGPMTGLPNFNRQAFFSAESKLLDEGHLVLNPANLPNGLTQKEYMRICCAMLDCADTIFMLENWDASAGARAELSLAIKLEHKVIYQGLE